MARIVMLYRMCVRVCAALERRDDYDDDRSEKSLEFSTCIVCTHREKSTGNDSSTRVGRMEEPRERGTRVWDGRKLLQQHYSGERIDLSGAPVGVLWRCGGG
ncbi:hypothetical protein QTP88_025684 [Uroleucon formosanum]